MGNDTKHDEALPVEGDLVHGETESTDAPVPEIRMAWNTRTLRTTLMILGFITAEIRIPFTHGSQAQGNEYTIGGFLLFAWLFLLLARVYVGVERFGTWVSWRARRFAETEDRRRRGETRRFF